MKISIIIAAYNVEKYIEKCLQSIVSQTYDDLEIIVVNDGSTDQTLELVNSISSKDDRIIIIDKPNGGLSSARNAGLNRASGEYLGFIDGDDYIHCDMYKILLEEIHKQNCEISMCAVLKVYSNYSENDCLIENSKVLSKKEALQALIEERYIKHYAWNKLYKATLFQGIRFPEGKLYEDIFTTYKLIARAERIAYTNKIGYYYVQRQGSILRSRFDLRKLDCIQAFQEFKEYVETSFPELSDELSWRLNLSTINSLLDMLKSESLYQDCQFQEVGSKISKDVKKNISYYVSGTDIPLTYKILSVLSVGGYSFLRMIFKSVLLKRMLIKKSTELL